MRGPALGAPVALSFGVLIGTWSRIPVSVLILLSLTLCGLAILGFARKWHSNSMTAILVTVIFLLGISRVRQAAQRKVDPVLRNLAERNSVCELSGSVTEAPEERGEDHLIQARISRVEVNDTVYSVSGLVLIRFRKCQSVMDYGDLFTVVALLRRPSQARNPGAFDYRSFVERKGITATATVRKPEDILETEGGEGTWIWSKIVLPVRNRIRNTIDQNLSGAPVGLLKGVLLGEKRGVPTEVSEAFARAGVNHVLAVSGLHVGLIAAVVFF